MDDHEVSLSSVVSIPLALLGQGDIDKLHKDLTFRHYDYGSSTVRQITAFEQNSDEILIPRDYGLKFVQNFDPNVLVKDDTSMGSRIRPSNRLNEITLWDHQLPIVNDALSLFTEHQEYDIVLEAGTGYGKTVMGVEIARCLGLKTLVIVDQDNLIKQWREDTAHKLFGLPMELIGHVQGKTCDYVGKTFVVATVQTLVMDKVPEEFYDEFGLVIWDEGHTTAAAEGFSKTLWWFNARYRLMVSATPDRYDAFGKILATHLGYPKVTTDHTHGESEVRYLTYKGLQSDWATKATMKGALINEIANDGKRNLLIAKAVKYMYDEGRDILVLSDRVEHLHSLLAMVGYMGVPNEDMGINCGKTFEWKYAKDTTPPRRPKGYVKYCDYTPVSLQYKERKFTRKEMEHVRQKCCIIFATFGVFKKGVDVPRLSGGIDTTPQATAKQAHGRILRETPDYPDKLTPLWVTIRDIRISKCESWFSSRVEDYVQSNAEVREWKDKEAELVDHQQLVRQARANARELKESSVLTRIDGSYMLRT